MILDLSLMTQGEIVRFATAFGERLLQRKRAEEHPTPVHLFLEEAQEIVPQHAPKGAERMLGAYTRLVKLGRNWGVGITLITQRPQAVSKECLNLTEVLVALQTVGRHERDALRGWIVYQGDVDEKLVDELPALDVGEAFIWSPGWLKLLTRTRIEARETFDSSATPKMGAKASVAVQSLNAAQLDRLRDAMAEMVREAEENDPAKLKREIASLKAQLAKRVQATPDAIEAELELARDQAFREAAKNHAAVRERLDAVMSGMVKVGLSLDSLVSAVGDLPDARLRGVPVTIRGGIAFDARPGRTLANAQAPTTISPSQQKILDAISWMSSMGVERPFDRIPIAFLAGYRLGGRFNNLLGEMKTAGLIDYPHPGSLDLTTAGQALARTPDLTRGIVQAVHEKLSPSESRVFGEIVDRHPRDVDRREIAAASGYEVGGRFNNILGLLSTLKLITYPKPGRVRAADWLFAGVRR